ncbi:hypothetical protein U1Q18_014191, partial [Sarracenia purpurea var. burkii]
MVEVDKGLPMVVTGLALGGGAASSRCRCKLRCYGDGLPQPVIWGSRMVFLLRSVRGPILSILSMALTMLELKKSLTLDAQTRAFDVQTEESLEFLENYENAIPERESIVMACLEEQNEAFASICGSGWLFRAPGSRVFSDRL